MAQRTSAYAGGGDGALVLAVLRLELRLSGAFSLKDKRAVLQSLLRRSAQRFHVSVAEVDHQDDMRRAGIAVAVVGSDGRVLERVLSQVLAFIEAGYPVEVLSQEVERR